MILFNGFEQILMHVIEETLHSDDLQQEIKDREIAEQVRPIYRSNEERFDNAMQAIFGEDYKKTFLDTADISPYRMAKIQKLLDDGSSFRGAIRSVMGDKLPKEDGSKADKAKMEKEISRLVDQARKHLQEHSDHHRDFVPVEGSKDLESSPYSEFHTEQIENRNKIFSTLREAGWGV